MLRRVFWKSERIFSVHGVLRAFRPSGLERVPVGELVSGEVAIPPCSAAPASRPAPLRARQVFLVTTRWLADDVVGNVVCTR
jgi:hypothetical protein